MLVVVTRALEDAAATAARLREGGREPLLAPVLVLRPSGAPAPAGRFDAALATSAHAFLGWGPGAPDRAALTALPLYAVGARTGAAARAAGFSEVRVAAGEATALVDLLRLTGAASARLLYLAGRDRRPTIETALAQSGARLTVWETSAAEAAPALPAEAVARLAEAPRAAVLHYSRRSAEVFLRLAAAAGLAPALARFAHVAISDEAAAPLRAAGLAPRVAAGPTEAELVAALPA